MLFFHDVTGPESSLVPWGELQPPLHSQISGFVEGVQARTYKPLLARPRCEGLEARIEHFVRRGRIEPPQGPGLPGDWAGEPPEGKRGSTGAPEQLPKRICMDPE